MAASAPKPKKTHNSSDCSDSPEERGKASLIAARGEVFSRRVVSKHPQGNEVTKLFGRKEAESTR